MTTTWRFLWSTCTSILLVYVLHFPDWGITSSTTHITGIVAAPRPNSTSPGMSMHLNLNKSDICVFQLSIQAATAMNDYLVDWSNGIVGVIMVLWHHWNN